jgi:ribonucleoside-diphosphate reductase alpha chain
MDGNMTPTFAAPISRHIWETRYRYDDSGPGEADIDATWWRVAGTLASVEPRNRDQWRERFHTLLEGFKFLPGGRILAGAGTSNRVTLFNCFVMGTIPDSLPGILDALKEGALTMQQGGGVGYGRIRLLDTPPTGLGGAGNRHDRLWAGILHAHMGQHMRDAALHGRAARRDDGHASL